MNGRFCDGIQVNSEVTEYLVMQHDGCVAKTVANTAERNGRDLKGDR